VKVRARDRWLRLLTLAGLLIGMTTLAGLARADDDVEDTGEVAAIQNRAYRMGQELELGVSLLPENAFFKGVAPELGYTIHFSDSYGL
jgi:hypothetical protein